MYRKYGKRIMDFTLSILAVIILSPIITLICILVYLILGRPILFRQPRPGLHGQHFNIYKFRTMTDERDARGDLLPDKDRLSAFGRFLRRTSLDEVPELINVLRGEMSLVGPRPLLTRYTPYFSQEERVRFSVRPGITGLAQISGRNDLSWDSRIALDIEYVKTCSFFQDISILGLTIRAVLAQRGLNVDPSTAMPDLDIERHDRLTNHIPRVS